MLALPQLKALLKEHNLYRCYINNGKDYVLLVVLKEHNLYRCYINKDEAIALLLRKGIITPADLLQPKDETKKATQVTSNTPKNYKNESKNC